MLVCDVCGYKINEPNPLCDHRGRRPSGATTDAEDVERLTQQLEQRTAERDAALARGDRYKSKLAALKRLMRTRAFEFQSHASDVGELLSSADGEGE